MNPQHLGLPSEWIVEILPKSNGRKPSIAKEGTAIENPTNT